VERPILGLIGTGLIGGSVGLRARACGYETIGFDPHPGALDQALAAGAIDRAASRGEVLACAGAIVIAAPPAATVGEIGALRESPATRATLILDVASVKEAVVTAARGLGNFVATHPMAGAERSGAAAADAALFEGRSWLYVPPGDAGLEERARTFIEAMGAVPYAVDAAEHDRRVALTSHLPQLAGSAFARLLREAGPEGDAFLGPTARELQRVSRMSFSMWGDIFAANAGNVEPRVRALAALLLEAADALRDGDAAALAAFFPESGR
jgi:prephenate dehydrogenase